MNILELAEEKNETNDIFDEARNLFADQNKSPSNF